LCKRILTKNPAEEAPVNSKNFLSIPPTFSFTVKNINVPPNKQKIKNGNKNRREPPSKSLNAGIEN
jgi:hypothetical protein